MARNEREAGRLRGRLRPAAQGPRRGRRHAPRVARPPRPGTAAARRRDVAAAGRFRAAAEGRLRRFRHRTILAVALTGLLLLMIGGDALLADGAQDSRTPALVPDDPAAQQVVVDTARGEVTGDTIVAEAARSIEEARSTLLELVRDFGGMLPQLGVAFLVLVLAGLLVAVLRPLLRALLGSWTRGSAMAALTGVLIWLVAIGAALSIVAGDARALVGSVGLFGLALSWALQAPIESFTGWLLNSFRGYYRIGDRIEVGEVFGDVYQIDFMTTTVWEAGGPGRRVEGAQPTGSMITFPNSEVLRANIVNYSRIFPYIWDEVVVQVALETDLDYALAVLGEAARAEVGEEMAEPAALYRTLLEQRGLEGEVSKHPTLFVANQESWVDITARFLSPVRRRREWRHRMTLALNRAVADPKHKGRIFPGAPRTQFEFVRPESGDALRGS
jgi:small conductance mechanosensitive channel